MKNTLQTTKAQACLFPTRKTWEQRRDEKITAEYVRLSNENRELRHELLNLRKDYMAAVEQLQELQTKLITEESQ